MFGLTELTAQLDEPTKQAIIPTFVIPFTILGMILTSIATWIAAIFGIQLKAEGPKRLFEVLMKPKILIWAVVSNAICYAGYYGVIYLSNSSKPLWLIDLKNSSAFKTSAVYSEFKKEVFQFDNRKKIILPRPIKNIEVVWQTDLKYPVFAGMISSQSSSKNSSSTSLFMGTDGGQTVELETKTGQVIRKLWTGQPVSTLPLILDNKIYVGEGEHATHHARYYQFDLATSQMTSSFMTKGHIERNAIVAEINQQQALILPAGSDGIYAIDSQTMQKIWQAPVGHVDSTVTSDGEKVFVGTGLEKGFDELGTNAFAVDLKTGQTIWKKNLPTSSWGVPLIWKDLVCFSVGDVYKNTEYGQLSCYNRKTGDEGLSINTSGSLISQPLLFEDKVITSDLHSQIYQLNLSEKKIDWKIKVPANGLNYATVVVDQEDRLILPTSEGLFVYSRNDQKLLYEWKPNTELKDNTKNKWKKPFANVLLVDDLWIVAGGNGVIYALRPRY